MHRRRKYALGWVSEKLGLWRNGLTAKPPAFLSKLLRSFYKESGQGIAWVVVESCRDSIRLRHRGVREKLLPFNEPVFQLEANYIPDRVRLPLVNGTSLSTKELKMVLPDGLVARDTYFTQIATQRTLIVESSAAPLRGQWLTWCLASQDGNRDALSRGMVPAGGQLLLNGGVNPARLMTWSKLDLIHGWTHSYCLDVHPRTGEIFSIRYACVPLRLQIELDPWLDDWLLTAIRSL